jgi:hypothetical protein
MDCTTLPKLAQDSGFASLAVIRCGSIPHFGAISAPPRSFPEILSGKAPPFAEIVNFQRLLGVKIIRWRFDDLGRQRRQSGCIAPTAACG